MNPFILLLGAVMSVMEYLRRKLFGRGHGISVLIPFRCLDKTSQRWKNVQWVEKYWKTQLRGAEVIVGDDPEISLPFSKSVAVNNAAKKAKGDVLIIVDADGFVPVEIVLECVKEIRKARKLNKRLWFVPYRHFFRLTQEASQLLLNSDPAHPFIFPDPLPENFILGDADPSIGHWYGAMIHIVPAEAFEIARGWDTRFRGWGGEDHAAMRAFDTLYWPHKTMPSQVLHIWHPMIGPKGTNEWVHWKERMWEGQSDIAANDRLSWRYYHAFGKPKVMQKLVEEVIKEKEFKEHSPSHHHQHCESA